MLLTTQDVFVPCPECNADVEVMEATEEGEVLVCDECGVDLKVKSIKNVTDEEGEDELEIKLEILEEDDND